MLWGKLHDIYYFAETFTYPNDIRLNICHGPNSNIGVDVIFNFDSPWYFGYTPPLSFGEDHVDFIEILAHELGHAIGLQHVYNNPYSIMLWNYFYREGQVRGQSDGDLAGRVYQHTTSPLSLSGGLPHSLVFSALPERIINLTNTVYVGSGKTFQIESNVLSLNLNNHPMKSTGSGKIIIPDGSNLNPDIRLMAGSSIKGLYPSIESALSDAGSSQTVELRKSYSLSTSSIVPNNVTFKIKSGATLNFTDYSIKSSGGIIIIETDAYLNPHIQIVEGSMIKGLYPSIESALSDATSGQIVELIGNYTLTSNIFILSNATFKIKSGATLNLGNYSVETTSGTISIETGATINPNIRVVEGSLIKGLYPTIESALSDATTSQKVTVDGFTAAYTQDLSIASGKILEINNSTLSFGDNKKIAVIGALKSNNTTFTRSGSSNWWGIRVDGNCIIENSTISYANYGLYAYCSSPTIRNNTISNCTYGIYLYNSNNAIVDRNAITACMRGIYGYYAGSSDLADNLITSGGSSRVSGIQVYATTEPTIYNNTIEGSFTYCLDADHYSRPLAIGPGSQNYQGYNRMIGGESATIYAHDHSEAVFGTGFTQSTEGYAGYNTIYLDIGTDKFANVQALNYSSVIAQKNYWGSYPPEGFYADGTSSIDYRYALSSDPGGGSSLGKIVGGLLADAL